MKRILCAILALLMLCMAGCRGSGEQPSTTATAGTTSGTEPEKTEPTDITVTVPKEGLDNDPSGTELAFANAGKTRITYTEGQNEVRYVTSVAELPEYGQLAKFDEAFFSEKALIVVVLTVNSGSVKVDIDSIMVDGTTATVTVSRELQGEAATADMATWLLWAEVEPGLELQWQLANPKLPAGGTTH